MLSLPLPTPEAEAHSLCLAQCIKQRLQSQGGWLSFAEFMQAALYEPGLGYYVAGARKFGREGDFVTAPEISAAFSHCLARQSLEILYAMGGGSILEFGAGTGVMAADILLALEKQHCLPQQYLILEVSPELQQRQQALFQERCPHLLPQVVWIGALPPDFEGIVLANEVMDAMPVHLFEIQERKMVERGVSVLNDEFVWQRELAPPSRRWDEGVGVDGSLLANGYVSEICFAIKPWLQQLYQTMKRGVILLIDYGFPEQEYYHPDRDQGTLMCHYRHHAHTNPFIFLGLQDITAHVNFSAVAQVATTAGFSVSGYVNQASFLMALGILEAVENSRDTRQHYAQSQALKKLLLPSEMGELFKVLALNKDFAMPLRGFSLYNALSSKN